MSSLSHHGIKGQRWGVRRFQNKDGTRTALGKKQLKAKRLSKNEKGIRDVYRSLSDEDFRTLGYSKEEADQERKDDFLELGRRHTDHDQYNRVQYKDGKAVGYIAVTGYQTTVGRGKKIVNILAVDLAVHSEYRGNGYSVALGKDLVRWFDTYGSKEYDRMEWYAMSENIGSQKAAERSGFTRRSSKEAAKGWVKYRYDKKHKAQHTSIGGTIHIEGNALILGDSSYLEHHGIRGQRWGVRRFQNKDGTLTAAGRKRKQHLIEVGSGKRKRLIEAAKPFGSSGDYSKDVTGLNRRGIRGQVINEDDNTHIIKKDTSIYRTAANSELNDDGTYGSLTKNDVDRYIDYGRSGELPGADKSNLDSMKIFEFSANRDLKIANGKYITEIITDDVKRKMKNGDSDQVKLGKEILESFKRHEEDLNISFSPSEMRRSKEAYSRTEAEKEFDRGLLDKANDRLNLYDKKILDYASGKDYRVIRDRLKREGYDGFIDVEDVTTITNLVRGGANTEYPVVILNANDVLTLKRSIKESETQRRLKRGTKFNSSRGELDNVVQHTSIGGTMYIEGNALILGDSSYLEHHGIRGQRWGVRRFQNRDGSLTNAGRKRLGYATKGVTQTVGKAFKAGVKAGGKAVKAVKAHHEKKEAEKLEKKKEKASKTRLGVMANKDLFTNEEIRKLNERFKLEDEMKMATLQKGVEIAKAVGTIAQNVGTVAKTYEDVTGQSLSPIKRKAAEEKARQDKEDRERRIAREDADEARKAAKEERDIAIHEQTLRKAIASADTQEFTAQKTKAEADSSILDLYKKGQDFNGGSDATGQSWVEKAKSGGKNPFDDMIANRDPEYAQIRKEHDEKVARKERIAELERREKERQAEKEVAAKRSQPQQKQSGGDDDALFSQKGSLPIDKDRYRNNRAMEKAKQVKEDASEERAKKQDEKAVNRTIDDTIEANRAFKNTVRAQDPHAYDRGVAKDYIKGKLNNLPNTLADLNPVNRAAKKIADKAAKEEEAQVRKSMKDQYDRMVKSDGRDEANYVMYETRVANLQGQGYSERKARQIADSDPTFSAKRNRKKEYYDKVGEIEATHRKNSKELNKANKELTDYYYKLINGPGYEPGSPKREALDRKYAQKRGELERLEKDNNDMLDKEKKKAKEILEHSFSIQNGVLFVDSSDCLAHHGVKGQRWGVRRFQNADGSLTEKGRKHYEKAIAKLDRKQTHSDAIRGRLERQHPFAVTGAAILGAVAAGMSIAATGGASVAAIAAGSAISAAVNAGITHASYSVSEAWEGRGTRMRSKKIAKYENMLKQSDMEEGMYHVENGTLFINAGEPYLEHHGVLGMKWGKHLRAGKGPADAPASAGGGGGEDDEKLKEMAKKAGMSVAEYKQKFASKIGGAASKVGEKVYDAAGGSHKKNAEGWRKMAQEESNAARASEKSSHENSAKAASQDRKYGSGGDVYRRAADSDKENAETHRSNAKVRSERAASEQAAYEKSLAGRYDKMKADRARSKKMKQRQSIERALSNGPVEAKPKKGLGKRLEEKLGVAHEKTNKPKQSKEAKRIEGMFKDAASKDKVFSGTSPKEKKRLKDVAGELYGSKHRKDFERNARLLEGSTRSAVEIGRDTYKRHGPTSGFGDPTYKATDDAYKRANKQWNNARVAGQKYDRSIAKRVDSLTRKASKARKRRAKHSDDTNAIYTEGTRLVVNSKWG